MTKFIKTTTVQKYTNVSNTTIPKKVCQHLHLKKGDLLVWMWDEHDKEVKIKKVFSRDDIND